MAEQNVSVRLVLNDDFSSQVRAARAAGRAAGRRLARNLARFEATWEPIDWSEYDR